MRVIAAGSTDVFGGPTDARLQLARVTRVECAEATLVRIDGLAGEALAYPGEPIVEVPVTVDDPVAGRGRAARVHAAGTTTPFTFTVAQAGWTMFVIATFTTIRCGEHPGRLYQRVVGRPARPLLTEAGRVERLLFLRFWRRTFVCDFPCGVRPTRPT